MLKCMDLARLREAVDAHRAAGRRIGLVPTMGNLHAGHLALVKQARAECDVVVATIYVNPLQFGENEDLADYPRTLEDDLVALDRDHTDIVFMPDDQTMYPRGLEVQTKVEVPALGNILCGRSRPGHFVGVTTVVARLFNMVGPEVAFFGKKDYQQLMIIRRMVDDLAMPVSIVGVEIARDADGLALSSRNRYLDPEQRRAAPELYRTLRWVSDQLAAGRRDWVDLEDQARTRLTELGFEPDYVSIRRSADLEVPDHGDRDLVVLAAARLGVARLIDNVEMGV
ncbi:MAG: pantoate--beta-alanine ligase [Gammaproteobacteria bacterium]|nr:pantoate--beta-alanine ligase [Gammaproteobacteria bacterium]